MSRPKPTILIEKVNNKTYKAEQVVAADAIYAVYYQDKPINLRTMNQYVDSGSKYKKVSFSNPGHAFNLAERLNKEFKTDEFSVYKLLHGEKLNNEFE